jgi:hypothetical protein
MLLYWVNGKQFVSGHCSFSSLVDRAIATIMDLKVDEEFCKRFGKSMAELDALGLADKTWVECVLWKVAETNQQRTDVLPEALEYHRRISSRMGTHLQLTCNNVARFAWLLGGMISPDADQARASARLAQHHLLRTKTADATKLESLLLGDQTLMSQLSVFADLDPPMLLWRNRSKFAELYKFIVVRFHSNPDHVLHCESVHAQWKWVEEVKRGIKFKLLNSILKLQSRLHNFGCLADPDPSVQSCNTYDMQCC